MIITLTGENSFALHEAVRQITETFVTEYGDLALERLDGDEAGFAAMREALAGLPFLAARKLVVLRTPGADKQFAEQFEQLLNDIPETTDAVIIEPKPDKRTAYYKLLKTKTELREFPELDAGGLARWLAETAAARGGSLSSGDARYLVERVGASQQLLTGELEKLLLYDPKISRENINLLTDEAPQSTIFQLLEAAFAGNAKRTMQLYAEQRALKVEPLQIIAMLAWQLHVLAVIKTAGDRPSGTVAKEARLNPFVVQKSQGIARSLQPVELKRLIRDLLHIDLQSKRSGIDTDEALQHYLLKLAL